MTDVEEGNVKTVCISIPDGAEPGDTLEFELDGASMELVIPMENRPGDILELQVAVQKEEIDVEKKKQTTDQDDQAVVRIVSGLQLATRLPPDPLPAMESSSSDTNGRNDKEDSKTTDGTYSMPWQCGIDMAHHWPTILLHAEIEEERPLHILELGSGLGTVGLSLVVQLLKMDTLYV